MYKHYLKVIMVFCWLYTGSIRADAMIGAYLESDGWNINNLSQFNSQAGKSLAIVNMFLTLDQDWVTLATPVTNVINHNAVPMLTWMPTTAQRPDDNLLGEISNGLWDAYIDDAVNKIKYWQGSYTHQKPPTLLIRFGHEFDGNWYPWGNSPTQFIAAWRHVHQRFSTAGVTGIEWVWCANNFSVDDYNNVAVYYPGDDVVDWTAIDGYNWGSNYSWSQWTSFSETFNPRYTNLATTWPNKPVMIAEVASAEPSDLPNPSWGQNGNNSDEGESKERWVQDMLARIQTEYPAVRAVIWTNTNKELSWALNGPNNTGGQAYVTGVASNYYRSQFSLLTTSKSVDKLALKDSDLIPEPVGEGSLNQQAAAIRSLSPQALSLLRYAHSGSNNAQNGP